MQIPAGTVMLAVLWPGGMNLVANRVLWNASNRTVSTFCEVEVQAISHRIAKVSRHAATAEDDKQIQSDSRTLCRNSVQCEALGLDLSGQGIDLLTEIAEVSRSPVVALEMRARSYLQGLPLSVSLSLSLPLSVALTHSLTLSLSLSLSPSPFLQ